MHACMYVLLIAGGGLGLDTQSVCVLEYIKW
jgi:hypothetical protein